MQEEVLETFYDHSKATWGESFEFPSTRSFKQFTHKVFNRYPARSISIVPRSILIDFSKHLPSSKLSSKKVLDPFMGSGTTAIETAMLGMQSYGVEVDPFARMVTDVSTLKYSDDDIDRLKKVFDRILNNWVATEVDPDLYPDITNIEYWFDEENFRSLLKLKTAIFRFSDKRTNDLNFFRVVLADIIRPCSKAERQSLKPYISSKYEKDPAEVIPRFKKSFKNHIEPLQEFSEVVPNNVEKVKWIGLDAKEFDSTFKFDIAITSPPYINALDYVRCIKLESAWAHCADNDTLSKLRNDQVGEGPTSQYEENEKLEELTSKYVAKINKEDSRRAKVVSNYFYEMLSNLECTFRALKKGSNYHLIIGNSTIRGVKVPTHEIIARLGELAGFSWTGYYKYVIKDHRTSIPRKGNGGKINYEHVITLNKD